MPASTTPDRFEDVIPATTRGGYMIRSASQVGVWWLVEVHSGRPVCHCPGAARMVEAGASAHCRHAKRLLEWTRANEATLRRVAAPANRAALVD